MNTIYRTAIRAVMLTPQRRLLLMEAEEPTSGVRFWFTPGGGIQPDEAPEACLCREIEEETGMVCENIGPAIWHRHHTFEWDGQILSQDEVFHFVPVEEFEADMRANPSAAERNAFRRFRWWTPEEIAVSEEAFAPRMLAEYLRTLIECGLPETPIDVGI